MDERGPSSWQFRHSTIVVGEVKDSHSEGFPALACFIWVLKEGSLSKSSSCTGDSNATLSSSARTSIFSRSCCYCCCLFLVQPLIDGTGRRKIFRPRLPILSKCWFFALIWGRSWKCKEGLKNRNTHLETNTIQCDIYVIVIHTKTIQINRISLPMEGERTT